MTSGTGQIGDAAKAWEAVRADPAIQYAPLEIPPPRPPPSWLTKILEWLGEVFAPLGRAFGGSWPVMRWILLALAVAAVVYILWRVVGPLLGWRAPRTDAVEAESWVPDHHGSLALLEDADRLAADGRFDEATHLLLHRSIGQIAQARPGWVEPATTARELAAFEMLPAAARTAFAVIADRVERSVFALRALGPDDWQAARAAYAEFALARPGV